MAKPTLRQVLLISLVAPLVGAAMYAISLLIGYELLIRSQALQYSKAFLNNSPALQKQVGSIRTIGVPFMLTGCSLDQRGGEGTATFKLIVSGEREEGIVYLKATKHLGLWSVTGANYFSSNGKPIVLQEESNAQNNT